MSSFTEYHKKWKEENGKTEDSPYKQRSIEEIQKSTEQYVDSIFGEQGKLWDKIQNTANNNLNHTNNMQNLLEMAKPMEDYTNTKRMSMQSVSNYVQQRNSQKENDERKNDKVLLFDNTNKSQKDILLSRGNKKAEIEKQIEQENRNNLVEQVYKQKNNIQENEKMYSINNKEDVYEKNLAMYKQNPKKDTQKNDTIWQDVEDIAGIGGLGTKTSMLDKVVDFAKGIQDGVGLVKEVGLGASSGGKQVLNYLESTTENANSNYKNFKERQFLTSQNVSNEDKMAYRAGEKIETNLVKKAIRDSIANDEQKIQGIQERLNYKVSQKLGEIAPSMGQMIPGTALSAIDPVLGTSYFMTSAGGGYINDALNRGMTEKQAWKYGTVMGALEGASESFITGQQLNKISNAFGGKRISKKVLDSYGFNIFENAMQETVMEPAQEITAGIIGDKADWSNMGQRMAESGFNGALMGAITNGVTYGLEKSGTVYNKIKNNEQVTANEYKEALQENIDKFGEKAVEDSIKQGALETYQEINNANNLTQNNINNQINPQTEQITQVENKVAQNGNKEKEQQLKIIQENNQADDDVHTWIRSVEDIKNFEEAFFEEGEYSGLDPDFTEEMANEARSTGKITVYSSYPIENGTFVSPSQLEASQYAGGDVTKLYSKKVDINDVAWIDGAEGQYAKVANNQETMYNNTESEGGINGQSQFTNKQEETIKQNGFNEYERRRIEENKQRRVQGIYQEENGREQRERGDRVDTTGKEGIMGRKDQNNAQTYYREFEQQARKNQLTNISKESQQVKQIAKDRYGKTLIHFDDNNTRFGGGLSKIDDTSILFGKNAVEEYGDTFLLGHEIGEDMLKYHSEKVGKKYNEFKERIQNDDNFSNVCLDYIISIDKEVRGTYIEHPELVAKELICDTLGFMQNDNELGNNLPHKDIQDVWINQLDNNLVKEMKETLKKYHNEIYPQEQTNQLKEVETNTQSLGYKPDIEGKQRKHYKSIIESDQVGEVGKQSAKSLLENDVYKPLSNIDTLATANENINRNGVDNTYITFRSKLNSNERITLQDIATGERLIQIFSQNGDFEKVNGLIQDVAMLGTELGQQVQAMSLIKKASPEGQLMYLQKVVERTNIKENTDLKVTEEMSKKILETKNETELENVMTDIAVELGSQLPITMGDKVRSWRYLSMLGNPKTHIKNLGANVAMNVTQQLKNKVAGATEDVVGMFNKDMERTKTLRPANKDQRNFAKQDAEFMKDKIDGGGKYDIKNAIQNNKRQFDNNALNAIANFNSDMLELEDNIFLKKAYQQAMQNYMSANKLSSSDMQKSSILQKAREYASYQAQEATFHQFSALAQKLTQIENENRIAGKFIEAVIPFKKTPINIAKSGVEYSPIGLVKSLSYDLAQLSKKTKDYKTKLEKGFISEAEYKTGTSKLVTKTIDDMAKGLTGTSLALIGYALKDMGILKSGNDGEDDEFKEKLGEQEYAIRIGDNTYTLDWVSPSAIPMFMGATAYDLIHSEDEDNSNTLNSLLTSSAKALEPMTEMSMLQGLTSAISSYEQGSSKLFDLGASAVSSYMGQFVPTALGQVAKTIDDKERDTSSTEKGIAKKVDQFKKQQLAKIPIASKLLPVRKDVWGNEKTRDSNPLVRAYEVGLAPYNRKKVVEDYTEKELLKVFKDTGEKSVLPGIPNKDITINKQNYRLTAGEYNKAKESFGKTSKGMLDSLVKTSEYKQLSDEQKAKAIDNIYSYAKEKIKVNYAKGKKQEVELSSSYNILNELKSSSNQSEYISYSAKIQGIEKDTEKKKILADGKYSNITKEIIYKNTLGKDDDLYNNVLASDNININEYLNYKLQKFESDKEDDGTVKGLSIKGSRPKKMYDYVNNMNITGNQKLAIIGTQYKLNRTEQEQLYNYINNMPKQTQKEKLEMFSKYSKNFTIYKDNTIVCK